MGGAFTIKAVQRESLGDIAVEFIECEHTGTVKDLPNPMENQRTVPCYPCGRYRHWRYLIPHKTKERTQAKQGLDE